MKKLNSNNKIFVDELSLNQYNPGSFTHREINGPTVANKKNLHGSQN